MFYKQPRFTGIKICNFAYFGAILEEPLTIFEKKSTTDVQLISKYASVNTTLHLTYLEECSLQKLNGSF